MATEEKKVSYTTTNSYSTRNKLTSATKNVWFCCHGLGFLSRYFIQYFNGLDADENYIIAPQAPSKYYQKSDFKHVGASWLTREETKQETENVLNYLDAVFASEEIPEDKRLILLGYSQGVSVAMRWLASRKLNVDTLVIHSGGIPKELSPQDFDFLTTTQVEVWYGTEDEYLTEKRLNEETRRAKEMFGEALKIVPFEGKHVVNRELINQLGNL
ncbi:alpha/beta hydrolase [Mesonia mobilis]|uniref:Esterase n=1 Tax=Mesonia mobilis TaxID=369791 RepID=A0ABQ3BYF5_9FLAO|nr:esterase [Mesonia mobilis]MBQ0736729.1 esterase [Aquimarina celericrescens]GGZ58583.1 esterase [Mesonia mobilis]